MLHPAFFLLFFYKEKRLKCKDQPGTKCLMPAMVYFPAVLPAGSNRNTQTDNPKVEVRQDVKRGALHTKDR